MSRIDITHPHTLSSDDARQALEEIAGKLEQRLGATTRWEDDTLLFSGGGVDGSITLLADTLHVQAALGFPLSMMQGAIETQVRDLLEKRFGT